MNYKGQKQIKLDVWSGSGKWFADEDLKIPPSDGTFEIAPDLINNSRGGSESELEHVAQTEVFQNTIKYQVDRQDEIFEKIIDSAQSEYDRALSDKDAYDPETVDLYLPPINSREELKALINPITIHVGFTDENTVDYIGYEFECSWDEEHGFGVRIRNTTVEEFGHADVCF